MLDAQQLGVQLEVAICKPSADNSGGAQFWCELAQVDSPDQLKLRPALEKLLAQEHTAFFKDNDALLYEMFNATGLKQNGEICHQDVQMAYHLDNGALQGRFRQVPGYIYIWLKYSGAQRRNWREAAGATLQYRRQEALELYDDWVQPHQPQPAQPQPQVSQTPRRTTRRTAQPNGLATLPSTDKRQGQSSGQPPPSAPAPAALPPRVHRPHWQELCLDCLTVILWRPRAYPPVPPQPPSRRNQDDQRRK